MGEGFTDTATSAGEESLPVHPSNSDVTFAVALITPLLLDAAADCALYAGSAITLGTANCSVAVGVGETGGVGGPLSWEWSGEGAAGGVGGVLSMDPRSSPGDMTLPCLSFNTKARLGGAKGV